MKKLKVGGMPWPEKKAQLIPCTVVLCDKGGTIQRAGCLNVYGCKRFQKASKLSSSRSYDLIRRGIGNNNIYPIQKSLNLPKQVIR